MNKKLMGKLYDGHMTVMVIYETVMEACKCDKD
jgi:hypothetical protein